MTLDIDKLLEDLDNDSYGALKNWSHADIKVLEAIEKEIK